MRVNKLVSNTMKFVQDIMIVSASMMLVLPVTVSTKVGQETDSLSTTRGQVAMESRYYVPPEPSYRLEETQQQVSSWERVLTLCTPVKTSSTLSVNCQAALSEYFLNEPIWDYATLYYYEHGAGVRRADRFPLNPRPILLPYTYSDYLLENVPLWRDIFDGRTESRKNTFVQVASDQLCEDVRLGGIDQRMGNHCQAREMFKYAIYLDACTTAFRRIRELNKMSGLTKYQGISTYDASMETIKEKIRDPSLRELARSRTEKGYLHAAWVMEACAIDGIALLPREKELGMVLYPKEEIQIGETRYLRPDIGHSFSVAMSIASRCGDEWAVHSDAITAFDNPEYLRDLLHKHPLLAHRHFGSPDGGFQVVLSEEKQKQHRAQAYLLLQKKIGTNMADQVFDASDLQEEIQNLTSDVVLGVPPTMQELFNQSNGARED